MNPEIYRAVGEPWFASVIRAIISGFVSSDQVKEADIYLRDFGAHEMPFQYGRYRLKYDGLENVIFVG